jgi:hypothetical protein
MGLEDDMKITGYGSIGAAGGSKKAGKTGASGSFADILAASGATEPAGVGATSDVAALAAVNNMLALQEISEEDVRRRKLVQQGHNLLDVLEKLRRQLLIGNMPAHLLQELSRNIALQKQSVIDPQLTALMEDIELRAAVELAKLEKALADQTTD